MQIQLASSNFYQSNSTSTPATQPNTTPSLQLTQQSPSQATFGLSFKQWLKLSPLILGLALYFPQCQQVKKATQGCFCINEKGPYMLPQVAKGTSEYHRQRSTGDYGYHQGHYDEGTVSECIRDFRGTLGNDGAIQKIQQKYKGMGYDENCSGETGRFNPTPLNKTQRERKKAWEEIKKFFSFNKED